MKTRPGLRLAPLIVTALLAACGGDGGSVPSGSIASTETFQLHSAWVSQFGETPPEPFTLSGSIDKMNINGSGNVTRGNMSSALFEGRNALQETSTVMSMFSRAGSMQTLNTTTTVYFDSDYLPLGSRSSGEYTVVQGTPSIPQTARVNDKGIISSANIYPNSASTVLMGTRTTAFALQPDSMSTTLLTFIEVDRDNAGATLNTTTSSFRMTPDGHLTKLSEVYESNSDSLTINF